MTEKIKKLIQTLKSYSPGDLVAGMEIKEVCEELSRDDSFKREQLDVFRELADYIQTCIFEGADETTAERIEGTINTLHNLFGSDGPESEERIDDNQGDETDYEVLFSFIQEANDHLENIEEKILKLETSEEPDVVDSIFRSMHTIKGVSSFLGLGKIKSLSHSLESVLDKLRGESMEVDTDLIDLLLEGVDVVKAMVAELGVRAEEYSQNKQSVQSLDSQTDISAIVQALDNVVEGGSGTAELSNDNQVITPEMITKFSLESSELLDKADEYLRQLQADPENEKYLNDAFRTMHTIKGNAGFFSFNDIESICLNIETVLDRIRKGDREVEQGVLDVLFGSTEAIRQRLVLIRNGETSPLEEEPFAEDAENDEQAAEAFKPLGEALIEMGETTSEAVEEALRMQQRRLGEILIEEGAVTEEQVESALKTQHKTSAALADRPVSAAPQRQDIRVDTEKLDRLFDLMGELITAEAMVIDNPDLEKYQLEQFDTAAGYLSKITREMQEITMTIRMIPLEGLFNKMRRLVRDLSRKFDKKINLAVSGQDTEMDRNVIEEISDPLVHIIRNAIDHGIEDPETRVKNGKEESGNISLNARYEGNEIWITIKDDGGGLDRDRIVEKAEQNGLFQGDKEKVTDKEVWNMIFEPGFSTAEKVSEVSGRGVGMDVVKRNIEKLRGKIDINSIRGSGTEIILKIPLTLAIIDGISFQVGRRLFSLPINDVLSFHKVEKGQITRTDDHGEVLNLRGDIIPILRLYDLYRIETEKKNVTSGIVVLVIAAGQRAGLLVDEVVGYKQIVVKALPEYIDDMRAISGCSIMGNGDVSLIIDTNALVNEVLE